MTQTERRITDLARYGVIARKGQYAGEIRLTAGETTKLIRMLKLLDRLNHAEKQRLFEMGERT